MSDVSVLLYGLVYVEGNVSTAHIFFFILLWVYSILANQVLENWRWDWLLGLTHAKKIYSWHAETLTREIDAPNSCRHWQIRPTDASKSAKERLVLFLSFSFCLASFFSLFLCVRFFFSVFPKSFHYPLTWQECIVSAHSRKVVYLFIVEPIIYLKLLWRGM